MLANVERAALLKCRHAGRYDDLGGKNRKRGTAEEYAEEAWAGQQRVPSKLFLELQDRGLIHSDRGCFRLTKAGREALENCLMKGGSHEL